MNEQNEFLNGLKYEEGETSQKQIAKEEIKKQLFNILENSKLKKGESKGLHETVEQIANNLGLQENKTAIEQYITELFRSDDYQYDIDAKGNIRANYSRLYMIQKANDQKKHEDAESILSEFIQRVETYAEELEQQKVKVTELSVLHQFSEEERRKDTGWINIAIDYVLEMREKQEIIK